jgi:hypothetical protein
MTRKQPETAQNPWLPTDDPKNIAKLILCGAITWSLQSVSVRQKKSAHKSWILVQRNAPKFPRGPDQALDQRTQNKRTDLELGF